MNCSTCLSNVFYNYTTGYFLDPPQAQKDLHGALAVTRRQFHFKCLFGFAYEFPTTL